jgi:hypothetical protein
MVDSDQRDIIDEIDEVTEPGPDAATCTPRCTPDEFPWIQTEPGEMAAVMLGIHDGRVVSISRENPAADITASVGDPDIDHVRHFEHLAIWFGTHAPGTHEVDTGATAFLNYLLHDVVSGDYAVSDAERERVLEVLAGPEAPVLHGPCMVTGITDAGTAQQLDDTFTHWFSRIFERMALLRESIARTAIARLGFPEEFIEHVTIIPL